MKYVVFFLLLMSLNACSYIPDVMNQDDPTEIEEQTSGDRDVDYRASFLIFINGVKHETTLPMFIEQSPRAYLTTRFPGVVQVKKAPTTWGQFLNSLPITIDYECLYTNDRQQLCSNETHTLKFFLNGNRVYDLLEREIVENDKVLVSYGNESGINIQRQLNQVPDPN